MKAFVDGVHVGAGAVVVVAAVFVLLPVLALHCCNKNVTALPATPLAVLHPTILSTGARVVVWFGLRLSCAVCQGLTCSKVCKQAGILLTCVDAVAHVVALTGVTFVTGICRA